MKLELRTLETLKYNIFVYFYLATTSTDKPSGSTWELDIFELAWAATPVRYRFIQNR